MIRTISIMVFLILSVIPLFPLGRQDRQNTDVDYWSDPAESILFGLAGKNKDNDVVLIIETSLAGRTVYTLTGNSVKEAEKNTSRYLCIRGRIQPGEENTVMVTEILVVQDSPVPDWNKARQIDIEGMIELGRNNMVCIVTNWESRSRVSHYVYGPGQDTIKKSIGRIIKVTGLEDTSFEDSSPFVKEIIVTEINSLL